MAYAGGGSITAMAPGGQDGSGNTMGTTYAQAITSVNCGFPTSVVNHTIGSASDPIYPTLGHYEMHIVADGDPVISPIRTNNVPDFAAQFGRGHENDLIPSASTLNGLNLGGNYTDVQNDALKLADIAEQFSFLGIAHGDTSPSAGASKGFVVHTSGKRSVQVVEPKKFHIGAAVFWDLPDPTLARDTKKLPYSTGRPVDEAGRVTPVLTTGGDYMKAHSIARYIEMSEYYQLSETGQPVKAIFNRSQHSTATLATRRYRAIKQVTDGILATTAVHILALAKACVDARNAGGAAPAETAIQQLMARLFAPNAPTPSDQDVASLFKLLLCDTSVAPKVSLSTAGKTHLWMKTNTSTADLKLQQDHTGLREHLLYAGTAGTRDIIEPHARAVRSAIQADELVERSLGEMLTSGQGTIHATTSGMQSFGGVCASSYVGRVVETWSPNKGAHEISIVVQPGGITVMQ